MIKFIVIFALLIVALLFGHTFIDIPGRVVIAFPETVVEFRIISGLIMLTLGIVITWVLVLITIKLFRMFSGSSKWIGAFSNRQQKNAFYNTINLMLMNEPEEARKSIKKTFNGEFQGSNYLIAAELERQANNTEQAQAFLIQAMDDPKSGMVATLKQAELLLQKSEANNAMNMLATIEGPLRKTRAFLKLKLQILAAQGDWDQINALIAENKKRLGNDYYWWAERSVKGTFASIASKQGAIALKQHWQALPRKSKHDVANQNAYVQLLIDQGLYSEAESELIIFAKKEFHDSQYGLFKQLTMPNPTASIKFIESQIKQRPSESNLYSVLANLAFNSGDYSLAQRSLSKALELKESKEDLALLAKIYEHEQNYQAANKVYKTLLK